MRAIRVVLMAALGPWAWVPAGACLGQTPVAPRESPPAPARSPGVQEARPDVFYLRDKDGNLQPVLGFTLEDFERLRAASVARGPNQTRPGYRLDRVTAAGRVVSDRAELSITLRVYIDEPDWVRVPLRLGGTVLRGVAQYKGPGEQFVEFDDGTQEYVGWFRGQSEQPHELTLDVLAPLSALPGDSRLRLSTPRASGSELVLTVPIPNAVGSVSTGAVLESATTKGTSTEFKALGLGSDFTISWRRENGRVAQAPAVLEATGGLVARIDGRSINTQAKLTVRSYGGEFDAFRVRLPKDAILLTGDQPDFSLAPVDPPAGSQAAGGRIIEVRLKNRTVGPVSIRLVTEQTHNVATARDAVELGGFEVLGAVRQGGHLAVQVVGEWQVLWGQRRQVRQVEEMPADLWRDDMLAGFEYFAQPFTLQARVVPRETRTTVEPEYLVLVSAHRVELEARLRYRVGGARVFRFEVAMADWQFDEVGPPNLVKIDDVVAKEVNPLSIPLLDPATGEIEVVLKAHRDLAEGARTLDFTLPRPQADALGSAAVVIVPADNIDLLPREADLRGLSRQFVKPGPSFKLPPRQHAPLVYRSESPQARFAADLKVHGRKITVSAASEVALSESGAVVQQRLAYTIARQAAGALLLNVPPRVAEDGKLEIVLSGQPLTWAAVAEEENDPQGPVRVRVVLPQEVLGPCELAIHYPLPEEKPLPQASVQLRVPLVMPGEGELQGNELTVAAAPGLRVQSLDGLWQADARSATGQAPGTLRLWAGVPRGEIVLGVRHDDRAETDSIIVQRAWIQSWFSETSRADRAVYRLTTRGQQFRLRLPGGAILGDVVLDGEPIVPAEGLQPDELHVPLPGDGKLDRSYTLDVRYRFAERPPRGGPVNLSVDAPALGKNVWVRRLYWQLVLPADEHLWAAPSEFTKEWSWGWQGLGWGRQPLLEQPQLERWTSATQELPVPAGTNRYLFSAAGPQTALQARVARRSVLVLAGSGAVLLVGLLLIYFRAARHPATVLVGLVALAGVGLVFPEPALVVAQAAAAGLVLVVVAGLLQRGVIGRQQRAGYHGRAASSVVAVDRSSARTQTHYRPQASVPGSTTATQPVAQLSLGEPKP